MVARKHLSVAIIGGGPGGLGTAIALHQLPFVSVTLYEQAPEPREVGAGISIGRNCWNVLHLLGAADGVKGAKKSHTLQRCVYFYSFLFSPCFSSLHHQEMGALESMRIWMRHQQLVNRSKMDMPLLGLAGPDFNPLFWSRCPRASFNLIKSSCRCRISVKTKACT
jgi:hypothetical protein